MRSAVAGGTGRIGALVVKRLRARGHDVVSLSRGQGVDLVTGEGLHGALAGVDVVIDVSNPAVAEVATAERVFAAVSENLLAAEAKAGVGHHIALSIAAADRVLGNPHYYGKRVQEQVVAAGPVPYTIAPATQFHDFPAMIADWSTVDGVSHVPPLLLQPAAPEDVADVLVELAEGEPQGRYADIAGPLTEDAVDMARRTRAAHADARPLRASWRGVALGVEFAGEVMLPGDGARITPTTFDDWLAAL
ncbi:NmrA family NAD(P)-binding protein [Microbacterium sp. HD4P20]|uniref:SDR family oxidoreductase n=1 Tax=Microbacterium sp. HD4P20 TaxID=2864874 RepID=UPI001C63BD1A|nr:NmrA family NAD(P)-binding protein [Microbacterium sp. HD4P20]MCP2636152.1 NmrA family NAD(P)-binding protein [Microbacterium sp. HD4P20]